MKSLMIYMVGLVSIALISPIVASAEESTSGAVDVMPVSAGAPAESWSFGESNPQMPPAGSGMGAGREMPPRGERPPMGKPAPRQMEVVAPRDPASGQASGKRMMASGTAPMTPAMEKRMEQRDRMMGSGTPMNGEKREEMADRLRERKEEIAKRIAMQMVVRLEAAIARYDKLADRLDSRVAKLKSNGVDTANAEKHLDLARAKIAEAKSAVALAKSSAENATSATTNKEAGMGKSIREMLEGARNAVVSAHKALVEATKSLKANTKTPETSTTTP